MPTNLVDLGTWIAEHWFGTIVFAIVAGLLIWRWSVAGKEAGEGPVIYAKKKHQSFLFVIGIITVVLVTLIIVFGGPWLGKFFIWGIGNGVTNTESVILGTPIPTEANAKASPTPDANPQASPTAGAQSLLATGQPYCTKIAATVRSGPSSTAAKVGDIPAGTTIQLGTIVDSNCVDSVCQRGQLAEAVGSFPVGSWIHLAATIEGACP